MNQRSSDARLNDDTPKAEATELPPASTQDNPGLNDGVALRAVVNDTVADSDPQSDSTQSDLEDIQQRLRRYERQNRWMKFSMVVVLVLMGLVAGKTLIPPDTIVKQTLMESKELKLLDNDGTPRLFLRMYSRVPVLQLLDANGKPRMSLGLRFDDTPFFDLSDKTGQTRASIELGPGGEPLIELFDENGDSTTRIR